ncbi:MAG: hypothetical protein QXH03_00435 [Candidatus Bathyarchaeia archaeon]
MKNKGNNSWSSDEKFPAIWKNQFGWEMAKHNSNSHIAVIKFVSQKFKQFGDGIGGEKGGESFNGLPSHFR